GRSPAGRPAGRGSDGPSVGVPVSRHAAPRPPPMTAGADAGRALGCHRRPAPAGGADRPDPPPDRAAGGDRDRPSQSTPTPGRPGPPPPDRAPPRTTACGGPQPTP